MSKPQSTNGSESEFEFIETPKAPTPSFEKFEECGVRTTSVRCLADNSSGGPELSSPWAQASRSYRGQDYCVANIRLHFRF